MSENQSKESPMMKAHHTEVRQARKSTTFVYETLDNTVKTTYRVNHHPIGAASLEHAMAEFDAHMRTLRDDLIAHQAELFGRCRVNMAQIEKAHAKFFVKLDAELTPDLLRVKQLLSEIVTDANHPMRERTAPFCYLHDSDFCLLYMAEYI